MIYLPDIKIFLYVVKTVSTITWMQFVFCCCSIKYCWSVVALLVTYCVEIYEIITRGGNMTGLPPPAWPLCSRIIGSTRPRHNGQRCVILLQHYYDINPLRR